MTDFNHSILFGKHHNNILDHLGLFMWVFSYKINIKCNVEKIYS